MVFVIFVNYTLETFRICYFKSLMNYTANG